MHPFARPRRSLAASALAIALLAGACSSGSSHQTGTNKPSATKPSATQALRDHDLELRRCEPPNHARFEYAQVVGGPCHVDAVVHHCGRGWFAGHGRDCEAVAAEPDGYR